MSIGRPREFDTEQVLDAAMQHFWRKGYEFTSLQNLLDVMHLSKSSFYQTYQSKHILFQQCIANYGNVMAENMMRQLKQSNSARQFIEDTFNEQINNAGKQGNKYGCLIMNTASEFEQRDPVIAGLVVKASNKFTNVFSIAIKCAQEEGGISSKKDPQILANYLVSSLSGLKTMVKAGMSKKSIKSITEVILSVFD